MKSDNKKYKYRPVLFFALAYLFTWIFWIPAIFVKEKSSVNENWFKDWPNKRDKRIEAATIPAKTRIASRTLGQFTL